MKLARLAEAAIGVTCGLFFSVAACAEGEGSYIWTPDHMQVGVRWQPFGRPGNDAFDAGRPVIARDSSYVQFWVSWSGAEPTRRTTDYAESMSGYLKAIDRAVDACVARGIKVELVFFHTPAWASESGKAGPWKAKAGLYGEFVERQATHFKGRVDAYQLYHEANVQGMMNDGDIGYLLSQVFIDGARTVRRVYRSPPQMPVIVSTSGCSPCEGCEVMAGLEGRGAAAVSDFYDRLIASTELMELVDALNMNVSDHFNGYGMMDGLVIPSVWANYDLVRGKLDDAGYRARTVLSSESWITWDDSPHAHDVNGDGVKDERDAYDKTVTIPGKLLERGLNTINLPWSDNSSGWSMGLTKRRDYNGRVKRLMSEAVVPAADGGPDVVTRKLLLRGGDDDFTVSEAPQHPFTVEAYINPPDPNHLHYYVWRWYARIAAGSDEVIRHALAGEAGNGIRVHGPGCTGPEQYKISSYNRTRRSFIVLVYSGGASGRSWMNVSIPARIRTGRWYNNGSSAIDFRGEGFADGERYRARIVTKDISRDDGRDVGRSERTTEVRTVANGVIGARVDSVRKFTAIEFFRSE